MASLADLLRPCGPVVDPAAAERAREAIGGLAAEDPVWLALAPVFAASPYLARLAARHRQALTELLASEPRAALARIIVAADAAARLDPAQGGVALRRLKAELHLLAARLKGVHEAGVSDR